MMWLVSDDIIFIAAACFQLAAMAFAAKMIREVKDRRPWIVLLAALTIMFGVRCLYVLHIRQLGHWQPVVAVLLSMLMFAALYFIRQIAIAERESENRYQGLVELSPDAIFVNCNDQIVYINAAALTFFGADTAEKILGRSPLELIAPESVELAKLRIAQLASERPVPVAEETWLRLDGSQVIVEAAAAIIPWQRSRAIQVVLRDISDRKRVELEKSRLLASERVLRSNAEHANRMKDEFLATLSHELRTPLNAILGWSQLLRNGVHDQEELMQGLDTIERNAKAQTQLIEDLLDMSRIISGKLRLDMQRVAPATFLDAALETARPAAEAKGITLEHSLDSAAGSVSGDPNRLQQVAWNLLSNAVKFTPRGGKITVSLTRASSHVEIVVSDNGQGISPDFLPFLFERFRQADASTTRRFGGLGLGLSIVKQLIDLHGGTVEAQSPGIGQGSTFIVQLPLTSSFTASKEGYIPSATVLPSMDTFAHSDLSGLTVLVVDDEPDARDLIRRVLVGCHAKVQTAASAAEAMAFLPAANVLISDIGMPDVDGYEFIRQVRATASPDAVRIPAIALTAFARSEDRTRALMAGYQVHLSKPVSAPELIATVASVTGRTTGVSTAFKP